MGRVETGRGERGEGEGKRGRRKWLQDFQFGVWANNELFLLKGRSTSSDIYIYNSFVCVRVCVRVCVSVFV